MTSFKMEHKNPEGLFKSKAFSQAITVSGKAKTIYIGGQNAVNSSGELVGHDDLELQTKQALHNIATILASENASFANLVKLNIYLVSGSDPRMGYKAFQEVAGVLENPPLVTVLFVSEFARPSCLLEIDGIAVIEDKD
ncbi:RidA family protein [Paenibacillus sp. XY044]|uniref:RidA family protein n=1 Tax=Paenibacillus sp. XY044 TaxID=2026089 RepID=UPI000B999A41|nr:RidA family protein [Paenibacillus sp. XY044]OZB95362.1 enamine deaminase RidA [Paenibacillus sp. XY044]